MKKHKIYLASPWFSESQAERQERIYNLLKSIESLEIFNPKLHGNITGKEDCDKFTTILKNNIDNITDADLIVAITDEKDMGTIWESGFAYAHKKPIIYYCETIGDKPFNLMLAKTGKVAKTMSELILLLQNDEIYNWQETYAYAGIIE